MPLSTCLSFCLPPSDFCRALNTKRRDSPAAGGDGESILISLAESARNRVCRDFHDVRLFRLAESCRDDARRVHRRGHRRGGGPTRGRGAVQRVLAGVSTGTVHATAGWGDSVYAVQAYAPENMTVVRGTIVQWRLANPTEPHSITGPALTWDSSPNFNPPGPPPVLITPGATFNHTFSTAGTFTYLCKVHAYQVGSSWAGMVGTVIVEPSVADTLNTLSAVSYAALAVAVVALLVGIYGLVRKRKP